MNVLVACEYSGTVRGAFIKRGYNAVSCDLLPSETDGPHIKGDVLKVVDGKWDLMIAHPPCTFLSNAGARHLYPNGELNKERYKEGLKAKKFFMRLWEQDHIPRICVENPISSKIFEMPTHTQQIQPYEYGHPLSKKTSIPSLQRLV